MWLLLPMLIVPVPIMLVMLWGWWHNRQVDKYKEWEKQQSETTQN